MGVPIRSGLVECRSVVEMSEIQHRTADELQAGLDEIGRSPADGGTLELIVRRPDVDVREVLAEGELE
ncbi:MAG: hypothetical protein CM1200mP26_26690 [Acidimicrobiales bacterium]|nr:MAG: hypothetical protein CM1200mP26_26690 [Acidimicrobiales bacterium]